MILRALLLAVVLAACGEKEAPESTAPAPVTMDVATPTDSEPGDANYDAQILEWARSAYNVDGQNLIEPIHTFYGDFSGDGAPDALAFFYHDLSGTSAALTVSLFRNIDGRMTLLRNVDEVLGQDPRDVRFERGRVMVTTTIQGPGDPRCCPTKPREWVVQTN